MPDKRLTIYNAGAGSGKTYQIAVDYLSKILQAQDSSYIYRLLGITFTNKAAGEMKKRIIISLINGANDNFIGVIKTVADNIKPMVIQQTGITSEKAYRDEIVKRCKNRLFEILHYYDEFQLMTIDKMMSKIIRTFARDMQLGSDVEIIMDKDEVISRLIDKLINQAEPGSLFSRFLIDFALEKLDDEKSWNIKKDLIRITKLIFDENNYDKIEELHQKTLEDFIALNKIIRTRFEKIKKSFISSGAELEKLIGENKDWITGSLYTLAKRLQYEHSKIEINQTILKQYSNVDYAYYKKTKLKELSPEKLAFITGELNDKLHSLMQKLVPFIQKNQEDYKLLKGLSAEVKALSIINELQKEITDFKHETNSIFISDFNRLILSNVIKDLATETPYIYMRLGEKYAHYFIDEFQDTSVLQWGNLIPLVKEGLSKEFSQGIAGTVMIVGDAKQSIYRFRGGKPEMFVALSDENQTNGAGNPFSEITGKKVIDLQNNWRSQGQVVTFNNTFFSQIADYLPEKYKKVYHPDRVKQNLPEGKDKNEGYVQVRFLANADKKNNIEKEDFAEAVYETIEQAEKNGFRRDEICILVDKNNTGISIAEKLTEKQIDVISAETLLVKNAEKVKFLLSWLHFLDTGKTGDIFQAVRYLVTHLHDNKTELFQSFFYEPKISKQKLIEQFKILGFQPLYD
jgi:ATP-dependent exoDNAse (exonuclease V) beta subunit